MAKGKPDKTKLPKPAKMKGLPKAPKKAKKGY